MALTETLIDDFSAGITANWSTSLSADASQVTGVSGLIKITHTATSQYNMLSTAATYDLTSSYFYVQVLDVGNQSITSQDVVFGIYFDDANRVWFTASNGSFSAYKRIAGIQTQVGSGLTYNGNTHRWWRFRESGGTIFWDTSPDGYIWTNRWSLANPFAVTAITPYLQCGCWQNESVGSYALFDNFNFIPAPTKFPIVRIPNNRVGPTALRAKFRRSYTPSITATSASTTTAQMVTGKSRIETSASQTTTGKARIEKSVSRTATGVARITATTLRTVTGLADILKTTTRNVTGKARIEKTATQTVTGLSRITATTVQSTTGKARVSVTTSRTILGAADIIKTTLRTIPGVTRIQVSSARMIPGVARVTRTTVRTTTGMARIAVTAVWTVTGKSRISITTTQAVTGKSNVVRVVVQTQQGKARITGVTARTVTGKASIFNGSSDKPELAASVDMPFLLQSQLDIGLAHRQVNTEFIRDASSTIMEDTVAVMESTTVYMGGQQQAEHMEGLALVDSMPRLFSDGCSDTPVGLK